MSVHEVGGAIQGVYHPGRPAPQRHWGGCPGALLSLVGCRHAGQSSARAHMATGQARVAQVEVYVVARTRKACPGNSARSPARIIRSFAKSVSVTWSLAAFSRVERGPAGREACSSKAAAMQSPAAVASITASFRHAASSTPAGAAIDRPTVGAVGVRASRCRPDGVHGRIYTACHVAACTAAHTFRFMQPRPSLDRAQPNGTSSSPGFRLRWTPRPLRRPAVTCRRPAAPGRCRGSRGVLRGHRTGPASLFRPLKDPVCAAARCI